MSALVFLMAQWRERAEPVDACADRLLDCVHRLGQVDPALAQWTSRPPGPNAEELREVQLDPASLREHLLAGRDRTDFGGDVIEELGFSASWFTSWGGVPVVLSATCGATVPGVANHLNIEVDGMPDELTGEARRLLGCVVRSWEPDWASWTSTELLDAQGADAGDLAVGWITYVARDLPADVVSGAEPAGDGMLVTLGEVGTPVDAARLRAVRNTLTKAGR